MSEKKYMGVKVQNCTATKQSLFHNQWVLSGRYVPMLHTTLQDTEHRLNWKQKMQGDTIRSWNQHGKGEASGLTEGEMQCDL